MSIDIPKSKVKIRKLEDFKADGKYCNDNLPLLNIPTNHIVPDELHLLLRVTDALIEALIRPLTGTNITPRHELITVVILRCTKFLMVKC